MLMCYFNKGIRNKSNYVNCRLNPNMTTPTRKLRSCQKHGIRAFRETFSLALTTSSLEMKTDRPYLG